MKLIAYDIANLTDARYFAARGAHMIGFSTVLSTVEQVNAMKDWVDVPAFFLHLPPNPSADLIWEWQERTSIDRFLVSNLSDDVLAMFPDAQWMYFFNSNDQAVYHELSCFFIDFNSLPFWLANKTNFGSSDDMPVYIEYNSETASKLNEIEEVAGVVIRGSQEDKLGIKSYEEIDDFLDSIEIDF